MKNIIYISIIAALFLISCSSSEEFGTSDYSPPTIKYQPRLIYPTLAQDNYWQGKSIILLKIDRNGKVLKTVVSKSSGYKLLDDAAMDYCSSIIFNPAISNETAVASQIRMGIDFNFDDESFDADDYVSEINQLYKEIEKNKEKKSIYQVQVLAKHSDFASKFRDAKLFNDYLAKVIKPETVKNWQSVWNSWPLSFLLFDDFLKRYPDYDSSESVEKKLLLSLKDDVQYINNSYSATGDKEVVLGKIISFMKKEYPNLSLDEIEFYKGTPTI